MTEQELDQRLATGMADLNNALDEELDVEAGLADSQLPALQKTLVEDLDDVLDLDAGLDHILPTPTHPGRRTTDSVPETDLNTPGTALSRFADDLASRSLQERLMARVWLPLTELIDLRVTALLVIRARDLSDSVANARHMMAGRRTLARRDILYRAINHVHELAIAIEYDVASDRIRSAPDALPLIHELVAILNQSRAQALTSDIRRALTLATALDRALATAFDRCLASALNQARALANASELAIALARKAHFDTAAIDAVDRLLKAVTDVTGDDLTQVDLHGVPLGGLRWSDGPAGTRWPIEWQGQIRENSVEISPGLYEIRYGDITVDTTV